MANTIPIPRAHTEPGCPADILAICSAVGGNYALRHAFEGWSFRTSETNRATFEIRRTLLRQLREIATHVRVTLDGDRYRVELLRVSSLHPDGREVAAIAGLSSDEVRTFIESRTGLQLSMGTIGGGG